MGPDPLAGTPLTCVYISENAALPHGSGSDRVLGKEDFVLFDVGGALYGYHSDITRVCTSLLTRCKIRSSYPV